MKLAVFAASLLSLAIAGCNPQVAEPVSPTVTVPPDGAQVCASHCATMGLQLSGVVIVANRMGCVCAPPVFGPPPPGGPPGVSTLNGAAGTVLAMIADDEARAAAAQASRRRRQY